MTMKRRSPTLTDRVTILDEPVLEFGGGQRAIDPHDGLALFGAFSGLASPAYIVLGTERGLELWDRWAAASNRPAFHPDRDKHRLWPPYPGFEVAFGQPWPDRAQRRYTIDRSSLLHASRKADQHERCYAVVEHLLDHFPKARTLDRVPAVAVCIVPDEVWQNCRPESRVLDPVDERISRGEKEARKAGQSDFFRPAVDPNQYYLSPDFRRQFKARTMEHDIPVQIIRESTLRLSDEVKRGERGLTPLSDRMWNLATTLYYKCGGKPWKLTAARPGVCYIGIAFRRAPEGGKTACCAAQMFLDSGDGIVFLGDFGPWYSPEKNDFHLDKNGARKLLSGVLETYNRVKTPQDPCITEVFLHSRSTISDEEFGGYQEVCPPGCKLVGVRVRPDRFGPRLFRDGRMAIQRGTFWRVSRRTGFLFGSGFKPRLGTYDGWETPVPLNVDLQHGDASIDQVAADILALTKLNYNACRLGESQPVTVGFSDAVGEILITNPTVPVRRHNFKFFI